MKKLVPAFALAVAAALALVHETNFTGSSDCDDAARAMAMGFVWD